jgi:hypothetical protein
MSSLFKKSIPNNFKNNILLRDLKPFNIVTFMENQKQNYGLVKEIIKEGIFKPSHFVDIKLLNIDKSFGTHVKVKPGILFIEKDRYGIIKLLLDECRKKYKKNNNKELYIEIYNVLLSMFNEIIKKYVNDMHLIKIAGQEKNYNSNKSNEYLNTYQSYININDKSQINTMPINNKTNNGLTNITPVNEKIGGKIKKPVTKKPVTKKPITKKPLTKKPLTKKLASK